MEHFIDRLEDLTDNADIFRLHELYNDLEDNIQAHIEELEYLWKLEHIISSLIPVSDDDYLYVLWDAVGEVIDECDEELVALYTDHDYVRHLILKHIGELEDV